MPADRDADYTTLLGNGGRVFERHGHVFGLDEREPVLGTKMIYPCSVHWQSCWQVYEVLSLDLVLDD